MNRLKLVMLASLLTICVSACSTTGPAPTTNDCLGAHYFRPEIIAQLNRSELEQEINHNDQEVARGCAVPNKVEFVQEYVQVN